MPTPTDTRHLQIAEYLVAQLAAIVGGITSPQGFTYHYTPAKVIRVDEPLVSHFVEAREQGHQVMYLVFSGDAETDTIRTTATLDKDAEFGIVGARWAEADNRPLRQDGSVDPFATDAVPRRSKVVDNLLGDLEAKLRESEGQQLVDGRLAWDLEMHRNRHYYVDGWDCAHAVLFVKYRHMRAVP